MPTLTQHGASTPGSNEVQASSERTPPDLLALLPTALSLYTGACCKTRLITIWRAQMRMPSPPTCRPWCRRALQTSTCCAAAALLQLFRSSACTAHAAPHPACGCHAVPCRTRAGTEPAPRLLCPPRRRACWRSFRTPAASRWVPGRPGWLQFFHTARGKPSWGKRARTLLVMPPSSRHSCCNRRASPPAAAGRRGDGRRAPAGHGPHRLVLLHAAPDHGHVCAGAGARHGCAGGPGLPPFSCKRPCWVCKDFETAAAALSS